MADITIQVADILRLKHLYPPCRLVAPAILAGGHAGENRPAQAVSRRHSPLQWERTLTASHPLLWQLDNPYVLVPGLPRLALVDLQSDDSDLRDRLVRFGVVNGVLSVDP